MMDSRTMRFGWLGLGLAVAGMLLGSPGAALAASLPDLKVTALTNPPSTALPGETFAVTATVKNGGGAEAPTSTTTFSLSKDKKTATKDLKGVQLVPALPATAFFTSVATVAIVPGTPPGIYYLQACADGLAKISESSEINNCRWTAETITVQPLPDLVVTAITDPPAAVRPGQSFKVTNTVKNAGLVPSAAATTKYSLVSTSSVAQADLDGAQAVPGLNAGKPFTEEETVTVRGDTPLGEYRLQACADSGKAVAEDDETDNCLLSVGTILVATLPDLRLSAVTLANAPAVVTPGGTIDIGAVVQNAGVGDAGASTITFALVNAAGTARNLTGTQAVPVVASGTTTPTQTTVTVPLDMPLRTYTARACIDAGGAVPEASDANNCTSAPGTVKVVAVVQLKPDLIVAALTDAPISVLPSQTFTATATIKNQGVDASAASTTKFNLVSADGRTRKNLSGVQRVAALAAGASSDGTAVTLKVSSDTIPGAYFFQACADSAEEVAEADENNNCVTMPRGIQVRESPDLLATAVSDPPLTATQGQSIAVTSTIQNVGTVTATESTTRYYLVATDGSGKLDLKGKPILPAIDPGHSFTENDTVSVRLETVPGTYFLQACADSKKVLAEKNENNNCITSAKSILVTQRPDLVVNSVALKDAQPSVGLNGAISVEVVVQNLGPGPAGESALRLFLIDPAGVSKDLKGHPSVPALATTKSTTVKGSVKVFRDTKLGKGYTLRACVDYAEVVVEIDENNNCADGKETIEVTPEVIPVPVP
jgi:subtilase family serine protease